MMSKPTLDQLLSKKVQLTKMLMPTSMYSSLSPYHMTPTRITVHNTANRATAMQEASYVLSGKGGASYHLAVDDYRVVQILPFDRNGWHCGDGVSGVGNRESIGIEICHSTNPDESIFTKSEDNGAFVTAVLLVLYGWNIKQITKHQDYPMWSSVQNKYTFKYCPHRTLDRGWKRYVDMVMEYYDEIRRSLSVPAPVIVVPTARPFPSYIKVEELSEPVSAQLVATPTNLWNFNVKSWSEFKSVKVYPKGTKMSFVAKATNTFTQSSYYMTEYSFTRGITNGFNVKDVVLNPKVNESTGFKVGDLVYVKQSVSTDYNGVKVIPEWHTTAKVISSINNDRVLLDRSGWCTAFRIHDLTKDAPKSTTTTKPTSPAVSVASGGSTYPRFKVNELVAVVPGSKDYNGASLSDMMYRNSFKIHSLSKNGARVVLMDHYGTIMAAIHASKLYRYNLPSTANDTFRKGDRVRVTDNVAFDGTPLSYEVKNRTYTVLENPNGARVVIGINGVVTAAVRSSNLRKV